MKKTLVNFYGPFLFCTLIAYFFQNMMLFSPDISYLLIAANQVLHGGTYVKDFLETNPPLILYLYSPVCIVVKLFSIDIVLLFRLYIYLFIFISLNLSWNFLTKIIKPEDKVLYYIVISTVLFVTLFLPLIELGQRENIFIIFILPYLFSTVLALENKPISLTSKISTGILAGLGFSLKPFFLAPLILIELYYLIKKFPKNPLRIETFIIGFVIISYLCSVYFFHPNYFKIVLPLVLDFYFDGVKQTWLNFLTTPLFKFCLLAMFFYFGFYKIDQYQIFSKVLFLALIGMIIAVVIPRTAWFYHLLPAVAMAYLIMSNLFGQVVTNSIRKNFHWYRDTTILLATGFFIFFTPIYSAYRDFEVILQPWLATLNPMVKFFNAQSGTHSITCLTSNGTATCFPLIHLSHSEFGSRYPFLWWYQGLKKKNNVLTEKMLREKDFLIKSVADDLTTRQPRWVILRNNEILEFLSTNLEFRNAWKHYSYRTTISSHQIFEKEV